MPTAPATSPSTSIYSLPQFVYLLDKYSFKYFSQLSDFAIIVYITMLDFERYCSADIAQDYCLMPEPYFIFRHRSSNDFERSIERRARVPVKQILIIQLKADGSLVLLNYLEQIEPSFLNYYFSPLIQYARHRISQIFIVCTSGISPFCADFKASLQYRTQVSVSPLFSCNEANLRRTRAYYFYSPYDF